MPRSARPTPSIVTACARSVFTLRCTITRSRANARAGCGRWQPLVRERQYSCTAAFSPSAFESGWGLQARSTFASATLDLHAVALGYPAVPIVIPHFGAGLFREALMVADLCSNVLF